MSTFAEIIASSTSEKETRDEDYRKRMAYVNKVSSALAQRLYERVGTAIKTSFETAKETGRPVPPATILTMTDESYFIGLPIRSTGQYDSTLPVFADGNGNVFPQEIKPPDGFPVREGDEHRIPISQCIFGFNTGPSLHDRGISPLLEQLHSRLNAETPIAIYLVPAGHGKLCLHIVWDVERFVYNQKKRATKQGMSFIPTVILPFP